MTEEKEKKSYLNQGTLVPIGFIIGVACFIIWFTTVASNASTARAEIVELKARVVLMEDKNKNSEVLTESRLTRIETKLDSVVEALKIK